VKQIDLFAVESLNKNLIATREPTRVRNLTTKGFTLHTNKKLEIKQKKVQCDKLIARGQKNKNNNLPWSLNMLIFPFPSLFVKSRKKERKKR